MFTLHKQLDIFPCSISKHKLSVKGWNRCEQTKDLPLDVFEESVSRDSYGVYDSVLAVAYALHAASSPRGKHMKTVGRGDRSKYLKLQPWQLHPFLSDLVLFNTSQSTIYLDEDGELGANFDIWNTVVWPNSSVATVKFGSLERQESSGKNFHIEESAIVWLKGLNQMLTYAPIAQKMSIHTKTVITVSPKTSLSYLMKKLWASSWSPLPFSSS
ncbi:hypothetical protein JD844_013981 [Phrynosoma platyrhinos]|uniref:Uncharacterized protein n=1 Tax=Phrynosoma platyrhinos TaxID=52577 RepID=A0ABQ7TLJ4_PHRPL|nr:hypothetical protein JD844_013981 [Phrynosoma platyrhinos]